MSVGLYTGSNAITFFPTSTGANPCFTFTDKDNSACELALYANYWDEQISLYGQIVDWYQNNTTLLSADDLYGEQPTQAFSIPQQITIGINLAENALMLSRYGLVSDDEITAYIPYQTFYNAFGYNAEPKSGDLFKLTNYGSDRVGGREGNIYEVTQRLDEDISQINQLAGHYVWLIKAKRYERSFEPGLSGEAVNNQVFDDSMVPTASGSIKDYPYNIDVETDTLVFSYSANGGIGFPDIYGGY